MTTLKRFMTGFMISLITSLVFSGSVFAAESEAFEQGKDYITLPENPSTQQLKNTKNTSIKVTEFFSYGCPACAKMEPYLEKWLQHKPPHVVFTRIPVVFESDWQVYAKSYLALGELVKSENNINQQIFTAVHQENLDLTRFEAMADFLSTKNIDKTAFSNIYHSPSIDTALSQDKKITTDYMVFQVPAMIIDGKYKVDPSLSGGNYSRLFKIVDYLIHKSSHAHHSKGGGGITG